MLNKVPLRTRLTIITAGILTIICIIISISSLINARQAVVAPVSQFQTARFYDGDAYINERDINGEFIALIDKSEEVFQMRTIIIMFGLIALGSYTMYIFAGKALKPVTDLSDEIKEINEFNLSKRIPESDFKDEISSLTHSFNDMLSKLEQAFESQKRFSQNAAHELKTPLTSIMTNIEVLELDDKPSNAEYKEVVDVVKDATERLIQLVNGLLKVNNKGRHSNEKIDLVEMFDEILIDLDQLRKSKNINVIVEGNASIYADVTLMERAFNNLVTNAMRYNNDNGNIKITISQQKVVIEDDGIGIEKEKISHIFEAFYCVDESRSKALGGTGLGLSIVKAIFNQYGLDYNVESEVGKGTKIIIDITLLNK